MIHAEHLTVCYGTLRAVDDVSLDVGRKEIFGIVGKNGAGKTTLVETIEGLKTPQGGKVLIDGIDPFHKAEKARLYKKISVQLQSTNYPNKARVEELCGLFSSIYDAPRDYRELLERFDLSSKRRSFFSDLSGGQKQKLSILLALISNPEVVFFDEITTGLDAQARHEIWGLLKGLREEGLTIVLVTHFMDDVEAVCDRVGVMRDAHMIHVGTQYELLKTAGLLQSVCFTAGGDAVEGLDGMEGVLKVIKEGDDYRIWGNNDNMASRVIAYLDANGVQYSGFDTHRPTMEDVFLKLTDSEPKEGVKG